MKVQSLRLSSIIFLFPLMFFLGGCNYQNCKNGDMDACEKICENKGTCMKACGEGNIYACALVCDSNNLSACKKTCEGMPSALSDCSDDRSDFHKNLNCLRKAEYGKNACEIILNATKK